MERKPVDKALCRLIDHSLLFPGATFADIERLLGGGRKRDRRVEAIEGGGKAAPVEAQ